MELILSAWAVDAACASAMLARRRPNALVLGVSKRRLPRLLQQDLLAEVEAIHIVGVGLSADPTALVAALQALAKRGVASTWYSDRSPPGDVPVAAFAACHVWKQGQSLAVGVRALVEAEPQDQFLCRVARDQEAKMLQSQLLLAAMSRYRRFGDGASFTDAVQQIAVSQGLREADEQAIAEYHAFGHRELRGHSEAMQEVRETIRIVGEESNCRVMITGETGTGKETAAYLIHRRSRRRDEPFWTFNCADLSPQLLESRLFGHEKGAFTGALGQRKGAFEQADKGTLFLDEVGELSLDAQAGLLRVLQEQRFRRLGGNQEIRVDVRILSATNRNLREMVDQGTFRQDLFYRLSTVELLMPALRERLEDLAEIANDYRYRRNLSPLTDRQTAALQAYAWPGNIRELQNILERAAIFSIQDFRPLLPKVAKSVASSQSLEAVIVAHVQQTYATAGNLAAAAAHLGVSINTVRRYLKIGADGSHHNRAQS